MIFGYGYGLWVMQKNTMTSHSAPIRVAVMIWLMVKSKPASNKLRFPQVKKVTAGKVYFDLFVLNCKQTQTKVVFLRDQNFGHFISFEVSWTRLETFAAAAVAARFSLFLV